MKFIGDFHIHSHFSIATSKNLVPELLHYWAGIKGIRVVATGDFTHPGWLRELREKLEPAGQGLFRLKKEYIRKDVRSVQDADVRFMLTAEISNIYKKTGRVRKVHNLIFAPDFETAEKIQSELSKIGNITSDGRPILGLDSRDLLEIALEANKDIFFVPCHIWTPWFSALGAKSGFDSIEECYGDLSDNIFAVETGLSSDPPMNWMCSFLDRYTLISNSDAHSPEKLGREANIFDTELSYKAIINAIKSGDGKKFLGTVEFFPQEGKYYYDGHRKCGVCWNPVETLKHGCTCPECGRKVTVGVMGRVVQLADRDDITQRKKRPGFHSVIPLKEILSEITGVGPNSKKVAMAYHSVIEKSGSEFSLLLDMPVDEISRSCNEALAEAVKRMRNGEVYIKEGFDGEFGRIKTFRDNEAKSFRQSASLFSDLTGAKRSAAPVRSLINFDISEYRKLNEPGRTETGDKTKISAILRELDIEQEKAAEHFKGPGLIVAGPGTGKTRVLAYRAANLIRNKGVRPENILAVTFTNKAAEEMKNRLRDILKEDDITSAFNVSTFHALGLLILRENYRTAGRVEDFTIIDEDDKKQIIGRETGCRKKQLNGISEAITEAKQKLKSPGEMDDPELAGVFERYEDVLKKLNVFDIDDLIYRAYKVLESSATALSGYRERFKWIMVDEYQDINFAQYRMVGLLAPGDKANLVVIGDPNQAIYGFRGADVKFIRRFIDDYPPACVYRLKKSYRCSDFILGASGSVVGRPGMLEGIQSGVRVKIAGNSTDRSEAEFVARTIEKMMGGLSFFSMDSDITEGSQEAAITSLSDFAVLCRLKSQMKALEKAFNDHRIPYQAVGDASFFRQEPVKSILDILRLYVNPGNTFLKDKIKNKNITKQAEYGEFADLIKGKTVREAVCSVAERYFQQEGKDVEDPVRKLSDISADFGSRIDEFLNFTSLSAGIDTYRPGLERVTLMTLHAAKGLEFNCVFITGCEDGLLPYSIFKEHRADADEERRLLYVGMTRAKRFLFLSHASKRFIFGQEFRLLRSPFLNSIEKELIELSKSDYRKKEKKENRQLEML